MSKTYDELAILVRESRQRVIDADPGCYRGFALDAAIRAVAKRENIDWRIVLKAYRWRFRAGETNWIRFSHGRHPTPEAVKLA